MSIIIMGGTGAGKSTVAEVLSRKTGYPTFEVGHVVKLMFRSKLEAELNKLYSDDLLVQEKIGSLVKTHSKDYFTKQRLRFTGEMIHKYGSDYFVKQLLLKRQKDQMIIVGVRTSDEVHTIHRLLRQAYFVALTCQTDRLVNRFVERERIFMDRSVAKSIFDRRYENERDRGLSEIMINCDLLLDTDYLSPEQLAENIYLNYMNYLLRQDGMIRGD